MEAYELDTARAKTPAERLRIVADIMDAQAEGEQAYLVDSRDGSLLTARPDASCGNNHWRYVTKRRPALVIPALELFEGPIHGYPAVGSTAYVPSIAHEKGYSTLTFLGVSQSGALVREGLCFRTPEAAARIGLHIREALAKAVKS